MRSVGDNSNSTFKISDYAHQPRTNKYWAALRRQRDGVAKTLRVFLISELAVDAPSSDGRRSYSESSDDDDETMFREVACIT